MAAGEQEFVGNGSQNVFILFTPLELEFCDCAIPVPSLMSLARTYLVVVIDDAVWSQSA